MKKIYLSFLSIAVSAALYAQSPVIFQPGPGQNDSTDQGGLTGGKDAFTNEGAQTTNYAAEAYNFALPVSNCNPTNMNAYIQFDLTGLPSQADSVFFGVTHWDHTSYCYSNCLADFYFAALLSPWYEQTIDYTNAPAHDTAFYGPITISFPNTFGTREYNITAMYNLWQAGTVPNYGFVIYSPTVGCNNAAVGFYAWSSDDTVLANRPYLKIYQLSSANPEIAYAPKLAVGPNPANDLLRISCAEKITQVSLYDLRGSLIRTEQLNALQAELSVKDLPEGVYFLRAETAGGTAVRKIEVLR